MNQIEYQGDVYDCPVRWYEHLQLAIGWRRGWRKGQTIFGPVWVADPLPRVPLHRWIYRWLRGYVVCYSENPHWSAFCKRRKGHCGPHRSGNGEWEWPR